MYTIIEKLIEQNRPQTALVSHGMVIHSTANEGVNAERHYIYWSNEDRNSSVHYVVDWMKIIRLIPENEQAQHAGPAANKNYLSMEMCEPTRGDAAKFKQVWDRTVWLAADVCIRYKWNTKDNIFSHNWISRMYRETSHTDPYGFLKRYNKSWDDLLKAIDEKIAKLSDPDKYFVYGYKEEKFGPYLNQEYAQNKCRQLKQLGYKDIYYIDSEGNKVLSKS